nr:unnamed protein product [Digitaria exilis]
MEAAAASSVRAGFGAQPRSAIGFRHSQRRAPACPCLRWPLPASRLLRGGGGSRPRGAIVAAPGDQRRQQLGELEAEVEAGSALGPPRSSPSEVTTHELAADIPVREEMARCFDLVRRLGRGAVYLGSSRVPLTHPHFLQTTELAREASSATRYYFLAQFNTLVLS